MPSDTAPKSAIKSTFRVKEMHNEARPRERLIRNGIKNLSNVDLLAILLRSGTKELNVIDLSHFLLNESNDSLDTLYRKLESSNYKPKAVGMGPVKAMTLMAAFELGVRLHTERTTNGSNIKSITCPKDVYNLMLPIMQGLTKEEVWLISLSTRNNVIQCNKIAEGGLQESVVDIRVILRTALSLSAVSVILVHNHPAGSLSPSRPDDNLTAKLRDACKCIDITLADHLIFTNTGYYSYMEEGRLTSVTAF